jgi:DNA-directed RNA polymerase specialized sigma subunit
MLDALRAMDSQDRSIMVMYAHDELTDREIAAALDLPPALVTRRRRKLLAELRDARNARPA